MDFSTSTVAASGFTSLRRVTSVRGDQELKLDALKQFETVARANPEADRLIMSEDGLDVTAAPKPFFGVSLSFILGTSEKETSQNQAILAKFQEALIKRYGTRVADFAFPDLHHCLLHGSKLDAKTIQRVLNDAQLFETLFLDDNLQEEMNQAVKNDIDAMASCADFERTSEEHDQLYDAVKLATENKKNTATAVTQYIQNKIGKPSSPYDPKAKELEALQTLWRPAAEETPENPNEDLKIFEAAARETDPVRRDRFVLNREGTKLTSAPRPAQGWTGAAVQWMAGRTETSVQENRRTVEGFRRALARKYAHTITNFVFPSAQARYALGSRLNSATIQSVLEKAEKVSTLLKDQSLNTLITHWTTAVRKEEAAEVAYRGIKLARQEAENDKNAKLGIAETSYNRAEAGIKNYLVRNAVEKNITIPQSARLLHLWFDEARERYRKAQIVNRVQPSAPPAPGSAWNNTSPPATNPNYRDGGNDGDSTLSTIGSAVATAFYNLADRTGRFLVDGVSTESSAPLHAIPAIPAIPVATVVHDVDDNKK